MSIAACTPTPPVIGVVVFDPVAFLVQYPQFSSVATTALNFNFTLATLLLNNSCCSVVQDAPTRQTLLNLLTAHITQLFNGINGQAPAGLVGRIATASEGSVNVAAEYASTMSLNAAFLAQTPFGAMFLAATAIYRTMRYVAAPPRLYDPPGYFIGGPGLGWGGAPWGGIR